MTGTDAAGGDKPEDVRHETLHRDTAVNGARKAVKGQE